MKHNFLKWLLVFMLPTMLIGCYPKDDAEVKDLDLVLTYHNTDFDFSTIRYYYMPDTVNVIVDEGQQGNVDHKYDETILNQIRTNLNNLGWEYLSKEDSTHLNDAVSVLVSAFNTDYYTVYTYPWYDYWGWYWGDFYFYWKAPASYYPYYPWNPGNAYYSYTSGTIVMEMAFMGEVSSPTATKIPIEWVGVLNGVMDAAKSNNTRIKEGINQAFEQSSYLKY